MGARPAVFLSGPGLCLEAVGQHLDSAGQSFERLGHGRIRIRLGENGARSRFLHVVSEQECRIEQMAGFGQTSECLSSVSGTAVDQSGDRAKMLFLAISAGDAVSTASNVDVDVGHQPVCPDSSSLSISPIAPLT